MFALVAILDGVSALQSPPMLAVLGISAPQLPMLMSLQSPPVGRRLALSSASAALATLPSAAGAMMTVEICRNLDANAGNRFAGDTFAAHNIQVSVGPPGFDYWCPVEISAPSSADGHHIDYLWLKDARTPKTTRIFAAKAFTAIDGAALQLTQLLKVGYVFRPMAYCSVHGLWEGDAVTVTA